MFSNTFSSTKNKIFFLLGLSLLLALPFGYFAGLVGKMGFTKGLMENHPTLNLNPSGGMFANYSLSIHMIFGAALTILAPIQIWLGWTKKGLFWHKLIGKLFFALAMVTGFGGFCYILMEGTTGGIVMSLGFGLYGILVIITAWQTMRYALAKQMKWHEEWATRLFVLAMASWFYRLCYGFWFIITGGSPGHTTNFQGPFDYFMDFAFYMLPLLLLEWYLRKIKDNTKIVNPLLVTGFVLAAATFIVLGFWGFYGPYL